MRLILVTAEFDPKRDAFLVHFIIACTIYSLVVRKACSSGMQSEDRALIG
jgi:hypothetical protein